MSGALADRSGRARQARPCADRDRRGPAAGLNDPRRFGSLDLVPTERARPTGRRSRRWARSRSARRSTARWLKRALAGRTAPIKAAAARPADRRRARQHLCLRGAASGADRTRRGPAGRSRGPARRARRGDHGGAATRRSRRAARRLRDFAAARRRARLFLEAVGESMAARASRAACGDGDVAGGSIQGGARPSSARTASAER